MMGVSLREIRERCQLPVRHNNDVAGLLYGDKASLPITKLFIDWGISPDVATYGMLVTGVTGSVLLAFPGMLTIVGSILVVLYYVFDCVDGEVARYRGVEKLDFTYLDFLFHLFVKPFMFFFLGLGLYRELGHVSAFVLSFSALISTLFLKVLKDMTFPIFCKKILLNRHRDSDNAYRRLIAHLEPRPLQAGASSAESFRLGWNRMTLRAFLTNFDVAAVLLLVAAIVDLVVGPFDLGSLGAWNLRFALLAFYAIVLPLDFCDHLWMFLRRNRFREEMATLLGAADEFRIEVDAD